MKTSTTYRPPLRAATCLLLAAASLAPLPLFAQVAPPPPKDFDPQRMPMEMQLTMSGGAAVTPTLDVAGSPFFVDPLASVIPVMMPPQGRIVEETLDEQTGVWSAWLSNGVRLHIRPTPLPAGTPAREAPLLMRIAMFGAEVLETNENRGISQASAQMINRPQPRNFRAVEVEKAFADRNISWQSGSGADVLYVQVGVKRKYLPWVMRFAHIALTQPSARDREFAAWRREMWNNTQLRSFATWTSVYPEFGAAVNPANDPRLVAPTLDHVGALTPKLARDWLTTAANNWPIEIAIDGPVDIAALKGDINAYFASLPSRPRVSEQTHAAARAIPMPALPVNITKQVVSKVDRTATIHAVPAPDESDIRRVQALQLAADMIEGRIRSTISQENPATPQVITPVSALQSVVVSMIPGGAYPGSGTFSIAMLARDNNIDAAIAQAMPAIDDFYENGPREMEFLTTRKRFVDELSARWKGQQVWVQALSTTTYTGLNLAEFAKLPETVAQLTREQVHQTFREVWQKPAPMIVTVAPEPGKKPARLKPLPDGQPVALPVATPVPAPAMQPPAEPAAQPVPPLDNTKPSDKPGT